MYGEPMRERAGSISCETERPPAPGPGEIRILCPDRNRTGLALARHHSAATDIESIEKLVRDRFETAWMVAI